MRTRTTIRRQAAAVTAAPAAAATSLTGCGSGDSAGSPGSDGKVNLSVPAKKPGHPVFLGKWPDPQYVPCFKKVVADYEKANPDVTVDLQAVGDQP